MRFKSLTLLLILAILVFAVSLLEAGVRKDAPMNPAFLKWLASNNRDGGIIPDPNDLTGINMKAGGGRSTRSVPPASYDLRALDKVTPVKDQSTCGCCWAFAVFGSLESSMLPGWDWDFSENNLKNAHGFNIGSCDGGNRWMATAYLTRWSGPIYEDDDPYDPNSSTSPSNLVSGVHVQDVHYLRPRWDSLDNDQIKQAVMDYGAVYTTCVQPYQNNFAYYNWTHNSCYFNVTGGVTANHAVCIAGWDDNYPSSNFNTAPPGNGAFLIRNSWGTSHHDAGYYWVSYYDTQLAKADNAAYTAVLPDLNWMEFIYQYDPYGWFGGTGYSTDTGWMANVFTVQEPWDAREICGAGWYAPAPDASYVARLYKNPTAGNPASGTLYSTVSGTFATAGYHTVRFTNSMPVLPGNTFSVVVRQTTPYYYSPICLEAPCPVYSEDATANAGESYTSPDGVTWTDVTTYRANTNVALKAYANYSGILQVGEYDEGFEVSGPAGGPFTPTSKIYTLYNMGMCRFSWYIVGGRPAWLTVTPTIGVIYPEATVDVNVSINANANSLPPGVYTYDLRFVNMTTHLGDTTRQVTLTVL